MENVCFGKEIKSLNILKNPNYRYDLFNEKYHQAYVPLKQDIYRAVNDIISVYGVEMSSNIRYITSKLVDARENSEGKLIKIMPDRQDRKPAYGILIYNQEGATFTTFYYTDYSGCRFDSEGYSLNDAEPKVVFIQFINDALSIVISSLHADFYGDVIIFDGLTEFVPNELSVGRNIPIDGMDISLEFDFLLDHIDIETKYLKPKTSIKGFGTSYLNLTTNNIKIIDSRWFTNLIKSDSFKVRGHFRLQPYGEGMAQKKIIWINDFQKPGYTATAKKIENINL